MSAEQLRPRWHRLPFKEIADSITERVDDPSAAGVDRYVGLEHLDPESTTIRRWGSPDDVASTKLRFYPGDVVYGRRRAYQRKLGVAEFEGICSAHALVLRANVETCLPEFLPYFLLSDAFHERAVEISVGSLSPTINWKTLAREEFAIPPLGEQGRVARLLDEVSSQADALKGVLSAADSLERSMFDGIRPAEDSALTLGQVADVLVGYPFKSARFRSEGIRLIRCSNVAPQHLVWSTSETVFLDSAEAAEYGDFALAAGDVVLAMDGTFTSAGFKAACVEEEDLPALLVQRVARLRAVEGGPRSSIIHALVRSSYFQEWLRSGTRQTTVAHVSGDLIKTFPVAERWLIEEAENVAGQLERLDRLRSAVGKQLEACRILGRSILEEFMAAADV